MKSKLLPFLIFLCILANKADAQELNAIEIGKACPDYIFQDMLNYKTAQAKVSDFRGKILILDFYATYCGPCIEQFPQLNELQTKYAKQIQVLLIGYEKKERIKNLFERIKSLNKSFNLPSAVIDMALFNKFLRQDGSIGGKVIISRVGTVLGRVEDINSTIIDSLLKTGTSANVISKDTTVAVNNKLANENFQHLEKIVYRSLITTYDSTSIDHLSFIKLAKTSQDYGQLNYWNFTIVELFSLAYGQFVLTKTDDGQTFILSLPFPGALIENNIGQTAHYLSSNKDVKIYRLKYDYCYDLVKHGASEIDLKNIMRQDLERTFGVRAKIIKKNVDCLVLRNIGMVKITSTGNAQKFEKDNYGLTLINEPVESLIKSLEYYLTNRKRKVIIDETGIKSNIDLTFVADMKDLKKVNSQLRKFNLELVEAYREQKILRLNKIN